MALTTPKVIQPYSGAINRLVTSKLTDFVSVKDFGALGDNSHDDTTAIQAAMNSGAKLIYFPAGTYKITSVITVPYDVFFFGVGINTTFINQVTADTGAFISQAHGLAYTCWRGMTITGAGRGTGTSVGVQVGNSSYGADYAQLFDLEVTNFGAAQIKLINGIRCEIDNVFVHGDPTGVLPACTIGLYLQGTYAFAGSNYDNRIGYVEGYNNVTDLKVENGGKNNFDGVYLYNQNYTGTLHHIHELNSSLNIWNKPHIEPLSLSAGVTAMWLIESAAGNPYTTMLGPNIREFEYENGTLGTTTNVIQVGTTAAGGLTVYGTQIYDAKCMPVSAGKYHVVMTNDYNSMISYNAARNNNVPFDSIIRDLTISNPNYATNNSYIGSFFEQSYGSWTPLLLAGGVSLGTLTGAANWVRHGKMITVQCDVILSAKTANTGIVTLTGANTISPNAGATMFIAQNTGGVVPCTGFIIGLVGTQPVHAYFNTNSGAISFYDSTVASLLTQTAFANGAEIIMSVSYELAIS